MEARPDVLARASADIAAGRLWKARDRLTTYVKGEPTNQAALELLGDVYFKMGDHPNAGRFWFVTERSGPEAELAAGAFEDRWGKQLGEKLKMVPITEPLEAYPEVARERIAELIVEARRAGIDWPPRGPHELEQAETMRRGVGWIIGTLLVMLGPGLWLLGIAAAIYLVVNWIG
jgi:hypothetical protein